MDVSRAINRLHRAHVAEGLGLIEVPGRQVETTLAQIAAAVSPWRLPEDLISFYRAVDPDTLAVAPCPRPAGPALSLRLWREHFAGHPTLGRYFPWCYESHDFMVVELDGPDRAGEGCFSWSGSSSPLVRTFPSVGAYIDLLATMIELDEFAHHPQLGIIEFDPGHRWSDAQTVRLAAGRRPMEEPGGARRPGPTTVADLRLLAEAGESPAGTVRGRVLTLSGSASGARLQISDGTGRLDVWCPTSVSGAAPMIDRWFDFDLVLRPGCQQPTDGDAELRGVERASRQSDLRAAVLLATPLYDKLFGTPAPARAMAIRPVI